MKVSIKHIGKYILIILTIIALCHKFIANDLPIVAKHNQRIVFPVCSDYSFQLGISEVNPRTFTYSPILNPIIPFSPYQSDMSSSLLPPMTGPHFLGTDTLGRDISSMMIHGTWKAFQVSFFAIIITLLIAFIVGSIAGYTRDNLYEYSIWSILAFIFILFFTAFYVYHSFNSFFLKLMFILLGATFIYLVHKLDKSFNLKGWRINLPFYVLADRIIEIKKALPALFLVLATITIFQNASIWNVIIIIGFISWDGLARYIRSEIMVVKEETYVKNAAVLGLSSWQIFKKHIFPNILDPLYATIAFSIISIILLEASLSFLGIGIPLEEPTWGSMLSEARQSGKWWIALFPGLGLFLVIASLNSLADQARITLTGK